MSETPRNHKIGRSQELVHSWENAESLPDGEKRKNVEGLREFQPTKEPERSALKDMLLKFESGEGDCLEQAFCYGLITEERDWNQILEDRNSSVHVYKESLAEELYSRLPVHMQRFRDLLEKF